LDVDLDVQARPADIRCLISSHQLTRHATGTLDGSDKRIMGRVVGIEAPGEMGMNLPSSDNLADRVGVF
jgi:hypothetical protein